MEIEEYLIVCIRINGALFAQASPDDVATTSTIEPDGRA
jgi:hypothetical protein